MIQRVTLAPELPGALDLIARLRARNRKQRRAQRSPGRKKRAPAFERGMRQVTHTFNCMSSMRRRGGERVAGLLEFALSEPEIFCELIADGHHVGTTLMRMLYRAKGAAGICLVTDATAGAGLPDGSRFALGDAECVVRGWRLLGGGRFGPGRQRIPHDRSRQANGGGGWDASARGGPDGDGNTGASDGVEGAKARSRSGWTRISSC